MKSYLKTFFGAVLFGIVSLVLLSAFAPNVFATVACQGTNFTICTEPTNNSSPEQWVQCGPGKVLWGVTLNTNNSDATKMVGVCIDPVSGIIENAQTCSSTPCSQPTTGYEAYVHCPAPSGGNKWGLRGVGFGVGSTDPNEAAGKCWDFAGTTSFNNTIVLGVPKIPPQDTEGYIECIGPNEVLTGVGFSVINDGSDNISRIGANCVTFTPPAVQCLPPTQNASLGQLITLTASGGNGSYSWSAPGANPPSSGGQTFPLSYNGSTGTKTVTVTSGSASDTCTINVTTTTGSLQGLTFDASTGAGVGTQVSGPFSTRTTSSANPIYYAPTVPSGVQTISVTIPSGYVGAAYNICDPGQDSTCHNSKPWVSGTSAQVTIPVNNFVDVWWRFTPNTGGGGGFCGDGICQPGENCPADCGGGGGSFTCLPNQQTFSAGQEIYFSTANGTGPYNWSAPGASGATSKTNDWSNNFNTHYNDGGGATHVVTVTQSGGGSASCSNVISGPPIVATPSDPLLVISSPANGQIVDIPLVPAPDSGLDRMPVVFRWYINDPIGTPFSSFSKSDRYRFQLIDLDATQTCDGNSLPDNNVGEFCKDNSGGVEYGNTACQKTPSDFAKYDAQCMPKTNSDDTRYDNDRYITEGSTTVDSNFSDAEILTGSAYVYERTLYLAPNRHYALQLRARSDVRDPNDSTSRYGDREILFSTGSGVVDPCGDGICQPGEDEFSCPADCEVAGSPNLVIVDGPTPSQTTIESGGLITFSAQIQNNGNADVGGAFINRFEVDTNNSNPATFTPISGYASDHSLPGLHQGSPATTFVSSEWLAEAGNHLVRFCTDSTNTIPESDENNCNIVPISISIGPSMCMPLTYNDSNSEVSPSIVDEGDPYTISCDYGDADSQGINPLGYSGACVFDRFVGTVAEFACIAGADGGQSFAIQCTLSPVPGQDWCPQVNEINGPGTDLDVTVPPFCGDGICQPGEDALSCPADCSGGGSPGVFDVDHNPQSEGSGVPHTPSHFGPDIRVPLAQSSNIGSTPTNISIDVTGAYTGIVRITADRDLQIDEVTPFGIPDGPTVDIAGMEINFWPNITGSRSEGSIDVPCCAASPTRLRTNFNPNNTPPGRYIINLTIEALTDDPVSGLRPPTVVMPIMMIIGEDTPGFSEV